MSPDTFLREALGQFYWTFALPALIFTLLAFAAKGGAALNWSPQRVASVKTNLFLTAVNLWVAPVALAFVALCQAGYDRLGVPQLDASVWAGWHPVALFVLYVAVMDFLDYWNHRLMHTPAFWAVHAVHHSDTDVNHTTSLRVHVLEAVFMRMSYIPLATLLNIPGEAIAGGLILHVLYNKYVHLDVDWHHGPLKYVLASPRWHRWHHADDPAVYGKNLAAVFPLWDVLFGTYHCPGRCTAPMGISRGPGVQGQERWLANLALPMLVWLDAPVRHLIAFIKRSRPTPAG
jgi:sterol desaturase/sphingolipid hydroxylase (fatty acid hydroxylase superfamily)